MSSIILSSRSSRGVTVVPNIFIDRFMPGANGTYIKVYLHLLRMLSGAAADISISAIADLLDETEKDILRALNYWEKSGVLTLARDSGGQISAIDFLDLEHTGSVPPEPKPDKPIESDVIIPNTPAFMHDSTDVPGTSADTGSTNQVIHIRPKYSASQLMQLKTIDEVRQLLDKIETCLSRPMKQTEAQLVAYFYDELGLSTELILYLYQYCTSINKIAVPYIEAVAHSWVDQGIDTIEKALASTACYSDSYRCVANAFGIRRSPANVELQFMHRWFDTFGFSTELVSEACSRTILKTGKPDFKYADKILESWNVKNVHSLADVQSLDQQHAKLQAVAVDSKKGFAPKPASAKFNQFPQRSYSEEDLKSMEQRLLNRG